MFYCVDEICSATTVGLSAYGKILPGPGEELITIGGRWLRIFRLNPYQTKRKDSIAKDTDLEQIYSLKLLEEPNGLVVVNTSDNEDNINIVAISFPDYRVTLNKWDVRLNELTAISYHDFAMDISISVSKTYRREEQFLASDEAGSMVITNLPDSHLGIVPLGVYCQRKQETISLKHLKIRLKNILGISFTAGYVKPTVLILYDAMKANIGRAALTSDTTALVAICLDLDTQAHSIIWHTKGLPSDLKTLLPIPDPVGGAILIGVNHILYMNQNCAPQGISLNACSDEFTKFPVKDFHHLEVDLQAPVATVISCSEVLIGSSSGSLYSIHLTTNETSSVNNIYLLKVCGIPSCSTLTSLSPGYVFVGSHVGNHLLLEYTKEKFTFKQAEFFSDNGDQIEDTLIDEEVKMIEEFLFERVVSSAEDDTRGSIRVDGLQMKKVDELFNYGPIHSLQVVPAENISEKYRDIANYNTFDVLSVIGHENDSGILHLQKSFRPIIISEHNFSKDSILFCSKLTDKNEFNYIVSSKVGELTIHSVEKQMTKLKSLGFDEEEQTIMFTTSHKGKYCIQVTKSKIIISREGRLLSTVVLNLGSDVTLVKFQEPLIALVTEHGNLHIYRVREQDNSLLVRRRAFSNGSHSLPSVAAFEIIKDKSGIFNRKFTDSLCSIPIKIRKNDRKERDFDIDNEAEHALYGVAKSSINRNNMSYNNGINRQEDEESYKNPKKAINTSAIDPDKTEITFCIAVCYFDGTMEIYALPHLSMIFKTSELAFLPPKIWDNSFIKKRLNYQKIKNSEENMEMDVDNKTMYKTLIKDIMFLSCGVNSLLQIMIVRVNNQIAFYEVRIMHNARADRPAFMFSRLEHHWDVSSKCYESRGNEITFTCDYKQTFYYLKELGRYKDICMIAGDYPAFFYYGKHGSILHHFNVEPYIEKFFSIHTKNYGNILGYITQNGTLIQAKIDDFIRYDIPYPAKKINKKCTVHYMVPLITRHLAVLTTSEEIELNRVWYPVNDEKFCETVNVQKGFLRPKGPVYKIALYSLNTWHEIPTTEITFPDHEYVTCCTEVRLQIEENPRTVQNYIAVGTSFNQGEEIQSRGRILLYEIIDVVPDPENPTCTEKLKEVYSKEHKNGVTALTGLNGFLMSGMGTKVFIWQYRDGELHGVSFLDRNVYITRLVSFRDLLIVEDICNGLAVMRYQKDYKVLSVVAEEARRFLRLSLSSDYIFRDGQMAFLHGDKQGNLTFYTYNGSGGVNRNTCALTVTSEIYLSTPISSFLSIKCNNHDKFFIEREGYCRQRHSVLYGTLDGSLGFIDTIDEQHYRRLSFLQLVLSRVMPQGCKLNFRISRAVDPIPHKIQSSLRNVLDITFIRQFFFLDFRVQQKIAKRVGRSVYTILDDLLEIEHYFRYH
uniref:CPSF_A domain-containing protein n=1 Tax=Parastrongyloides trichosuri TaxID=131310 RepID=A0A0N4ZEX5_PARTI